MGQTCQRHQTLAPPDSQSNVGLASQVLIGAGWQHIAVEQARGRMHSPSWGCWQYIQSHLSASWQKWAEGSKSRLRVNIAAFPAAFTAGAAGRAACSPKKDGAAPWHGHPGAALLQSVLLLVGAPSEAPGLPPMDPHTPPVPMGIPASPPAEERARRRGEVGKALCPC